MVCNSLPFNQVVVGSTPARLTTSTLKYTLGNYKKIGIVRNLRLKTCKVVIITN